MSEDKFSQNFYDTSAFTADISTKMRIPEHIDAHGRYSNGDYSSKEYGKSNSALYDMQVPDRIMLAGSDEHVYAKSTPRELQLEKSVMPPTPEHVRVQTPPRSIKLGDVNYDSAPSTPQHKDSGTKNGYIGGQVSRTRLERGGSVDVDTSLRADSVESGLSVYDEVQMMRRQIAKLNHRLMAVELENQQQQQRETVLTVVVSAYFVVKALLWLNKSM